MIAEFLDEHEVSKYVDAMRGAVDEPALRDQAQAAAQAIGRGDADPVAAIRATLPQTAGPPSSGGRTEFPFFSRDPAVSLLQTSLEDEARKAGNVAVKAPESPLHHIVHAVEALLHIEHFGPSDPDWVTKIAGATLDRLAKGNHKFNPTPAEHTIADDARVVIVGDWGSGLPRALDVARHMGEKVEEALGRGPAGARRAPRRRLLLRRPRRVPAPRAGRRPLAGDQAAVRRRRDVMGAQRQPRHVLGRLRLLRHDAARRRPLRQAALGRRQGHELLPAAERVLGHRRARHLVGCRRAQPRAEGRPARSPGRRAQALGGRVDAQADAAQPPPARLRLRPRRPRDGAAVQARAAAEVGPHQRVAVGSRAPLHGASSRPRCR